MNKNSDLSTKKGTIANVLMEHREELYELIENDEYSKLQIKVNELLTDMSLKNNSAVVEAKYTLAKCSRNKNLYYSTLMTYMTGLKVS